MILLLSCYSIKGQINYDNSTRLLNGWEFLKSDLSGPWEAVCDFTKQGEEIVPIWSKVTLPHCYNAFDAVDPDLNYYQGPSWYRTLLKVENPFKNGRTILYFEGVGQKAEVFVNLTKVGFHVGGYDEWQVDITDAVDEFLDSDSAKKFNGKVPIEIRVDNSRDIEMIPSDLSDFNLYGGLYRYVNLVYTPSLAVQSLQTYASVDKKGELGLLSVKASFSNYSTEKSASVNIKIYSPDNKLIKETNQLIHDWNEKELFSMKINKPEVWLPDHPKLYRCKMTLSSPSGTMVSEEKFGFRHFEFKKNSPFYLNGERLLLRGTHRHEDHAGVGAAMTEDMIIQEMEMMKEMGVNFIRLGHYQQSRIVLEQCDRLGILVWEEIPWCRGGLGGEIYKEQGRRMLTNMITQHRNHPSVILWGLGNENDWPGDFPEFDKQKIREYMSELHQLAHKLDDTRLTSIRRCDFCKDIVDVYSPSIWAGWYRGIYTDYKNVTFYEMQQVDHFLHVEWGGDNHARRHAEDPYINLDKIESGKKTADERSGDASLYGGTARASRDGDWSESYICDLIDWHLKEQETMPWLTGAAYWPFKDFSTPVRPINPVPYMNQKGVVERDFTKKEAYFVFQSYWTEKPMVHIYGHTWPIRWGNEGEVKTLKVYSNCTEAELFLNGKSLGTKKRNSQDFPAAGLRWETPFLKGENIVKVVALKGKEMISDELSFIYETRPFGDEAAIRLKVVEDTPEYVWIEAELVDKMGIRCLSSAKVLNFDSLGEGHLVVNMGTSDASEKVQAYNGRALIRLIKKGEKNIVSVQSDGLETAFIEVF
ncbi:MAG: glycoside hydrolase family 2 TIM barrel-domain containing protein [Dysgonamonadaceae bacterium]|nr:glycoside hydrolase family 2 TIM barrel-domain containing protein [Dysgonamonadaceae bacterium]